MKVHYEPITRALDRAIIEAERLQRPIEYIEVTPMEWAELEETCENNMFSLYDDHMPKAFRTIVYNGVPIRKLK